MDAEITTNEGISRRTIVKGAAWSIPVMAAAVAAPAAVATGGPNWDVTVNGNCSGNYDVNILRALFPGGIGGQTLYNTAVALLTTLGFTAPMTRQFTITATDGDIPAGTQFQLFHGGLLNVSVATLSAGLSGISASALNIISINPNDATFTFTQAIPEGTTVTINLLTMLADVRALSNITLSLVGADNPAPGAEGADSDSISTILGALVNLGGGRSIGVQACAA